MCISLLPSASKIIQMYYANKCLLLQNYANEKYFFCLQLKLHLNVKLYICRVSHSAKVNIYGLPFIREMSKITGISGRDLIVKCPVAGYPIDKIHWERGNRSIFIYFSFALIVSGRSLGPL